MSNRYVIEWYREDQEPGHEWFVYYDLAYNEMDAKRLLAQLRDKRPYETYRLVRITEAREVLDESP